MSANKKGLSTIISSLLVIILTITVTVIVWRAVLLFVGTEVEGSKSCYNLYGKVTFNGLYTCYNLSSGEMKFSVNIKDLKVDGLLIAMSSEGDSKSFKIIKSSNSVSGLVNYTGGSYVQLPKENSGLTYKAVGIINKPKLLEIAPIINDKQCDKTDLLTEINFC